MIPSNLAPLRIHARCVADFPTIRGNVEYCAKLGLRFFIPTPNRHELEAVLVGSGPSVRNEVGSLKKKTHDKKYMFFGIKGGHDFLLENDIEPHFAVCVDPLEINYKENFLRDAKYCKYFIASQCHPTMFDSLLGRKKEVIIWHLLTDNLLKWSQEECSPIYQHYMIPGGSTSGLRAIVLAYAMGFRKFHLYGYDSCLTVTDPKKPANLRKVGGEKYEELNKEGKPKAIQLTVGNKQFLADPAFASQANEIQELIKSMWKPNDPFWFRPYGQGLIQHILRERYREGAEDSRC